MLDLPKEVINLWLLRQKEQTGKIDINVLLKDPAMCDVNGGVHWDSTPEGHEFWAEIIWVESTSLFYQKFPKNSITCIILKHLILE